MITLHGVPVSVHARKAIVACHIKGLDYRNEPVVPFRPPEGWAELSPTGLVPVMQDGALSLPDSTAICLYLERAHPTPALLPSDPADFGRALWFDAYAGGTLFRTVIHGLFFQKVIRPGILNEATDADAVAAILNETMPKVFGYLERQLDGDFLVGGALSLADIAIASNLINYQYLGFRIDPQTHPRLAAYAARMVRHPAFERALTAERPFAEGMGLDRTFLPATEPAAA